MATRFTHFVISDLVALVAELLVVDSAVARRHPVAVYQQSQLLFGEANSAGVHGPHERSLVHLLTGPDGVGVS